MIYNFSKEVFPKKSFLQRNRYSSLRIYRLFDADKLIGTFEFSHTQHTFSFNDREYFIEVIERFFKKPSYKLFNKLTHELIGEFQLSTWRATTFRFAKPNLQQKEYFIFAKIQPDTPYSIFNKGSWGHYKFQVSNGTEAAVFSLKVDLAFFSTNLQYRPLKGKVELFGDNKLLLFAGLFLIERHFQNEDSRT